MSMIKIVNDNCQNRQVAAGLHFISGIWGKRDSHALKGRYGYG